VYGAQRRNTGLKHWRLDELGITDQIEFVDRAGYENSICNDI